MSKSDKEEVIAKLKNIIALVEAEKQRDAERSKGVSPSPYFNGKIDGLMDAISIVRAQ